MKIGKKFSFSKLWWYMLRIITLLFINFIPNWYTTDFAKNCDKNVIAMVLM
jgi:hypothetical protein